MYKIINAESEYDFYGPYEVFPEVYKDTDRNDLEAMTALASNLTDECDGTYVVRDNGL